MPLLRDIYHIYTTKTRTCPEASHIYHWRNASNTRGQHADEKARRVHPPTPRPNSYPLYLSLCKRFSVTVLFPRFFAPTPATHAFPRMRGRACLRVIRHSLDTKKCLEHVVPICKHALSEDLPDIRRYGAPNQKGTGCKGCFYDPQACPDPVPNTPHTNRF